jgi:hypothetical protein
MAELECDEAELLERAEKAYRLSGGTEAIEATVWERPRRVYVELATAGVVVARYRWVPESNTLRRVRLGQTFLYRVLENDQDGDPLDFGVLRAPSASAALGMVRERLADLGLEGEALPVRLYPVREVASGLYRDAGEYTELVPECPPAS